MSVSGTLTEEAMVPEKETTVRACKIEVTLLLPCIELLSLVSPPMRRTDGVQ